MRQLYPDIEPYNSGMLKVSDTHSLYYEESGNPNGSPVVHIHGGPGEHSKPKHRRYFNPEVYRIILYDQRGCGQSIPSGEAKENEMTDLVDDLEKLREHLKVGDWHVFGRSWGSALSLHYAVSYPERVKSLLVSAIFLYSREEILSGYEIGRKMVPEVWEQMSKDCIEEDDRTIPEQLNELLHSQNSEIRNNFILQYLKYIGALYDPLGMNFEENEDPINVDTEYPKLVIFFHYECAGLQKVSNYVLENAEKIKDIPTCILHGSIDMLTAPEFAYRLHKALPLSTYFCISGAAHFVDFPEYIDKTVEYTDLFAKL